MVEKSSVLSPSQRNQSISDGDSLEEAKHSRTDTLFSNSLDGPSLRLGSMKNTSSSSGKILEEKLRRSDMDQADSKQTKSASSSPRAIKTSSPLVHLSEHYERTPIIGAHKQEITSVHYYMKDQIGLDTPSKN